MDLSLKGVLANFEYSTFFSCLNERKVHPDKTILTRNNWEEWGSKSVRFIYIVYITVLGWTDFEHPIFSIISSQNCFIEIDLSWKMFLLLRNEKNVMYLKLVNNPFNEGVQEYDEQKLRHEELYSALSKELVQYIHYLRLGKSFVHQTDI